MRQDPPEEKRKNVFDGRKYGLSCELPRNVRGAALFKDSTHLLVHVWALKTLTEKYFLKSLFESVEKTLLLVLIFGDCKKFVIIAVVAMLRSLVEIEEGFDLAPTDSPKLIANII